ncbi:MAG: hypothetical protein RR902_02210 [Oscillospiraceae bacterium]
MNREVEILQDIMRDHKLCDTQRETLQKVISEKIIGEKIIGGYIAISKQDAINYENQCDKLMTNALGKKCQVSKALNGKLKVEFGENGFCENCIVLDKNSKGAVWVSFQGNFAELTENIDIILKCVNENKKSFEILMWTYTHKDELKD